MTDERTKDSPGAPRWEYISDDELTSAEMEGRDSLLKMALDAEAGHIAVTSRGKGGDDEKFCQELGMLILPDGRALVYAIREHMKDDEMNHTRAFAITKEPVA